MEAPEKLRALVQSLLVVAGDGSFDDIMAQLVELAKELTDATYAAIGVVNEDHTGLATFMTRGLDEAEEVAIGPRPTGRGVLGLLLTDPRPLRLDDLRAHLDASGFPPGHPEMTSFLGVPISAHGAVFGNLYLTNKRGAPAFSDEDEALAATLAVAAGLAIERARAAEREKRLSIARDRDRIARDLHDSVIQRLYATALRLDAARGKPDRLEHEVPMAVGELNGAMTDLRGAIYELEHGAVGVNLRSAISKLVAELEDVLRAEVTISFSGATDELVPSALLSHCVAVVREALTNVAKHAQARVVQVTVHVGALVEISVLDDGVGLAGRSQGGHGLSNLERRAERLGGSCQILDQLPAGTVVRWSVPATAVAR